MKKRIIAILLSISLCSCGEFLKPKSANEYVPETVEALYEVLVGDVYPSCIATTSNIFAYNEIFSDNVSILSNSDAIFDPLNLKDQIKAKRIYGMNPDMFNTEAANGAAVTIDPWVSTYDVLKSCNAIFDYIETVKGSEDIRNQTLAEAHLLRAFYYFNLVNIYGKPYSMDPDSPGVPIKLTSKYSPELMPRNTVREVYGQILADLDASESYYSKFDGDYFTSVLKPSIPLLYSFRSRVALYMEDWQAAKTYAEKVLNSKHGFTLYDLNSFVPSSAAPYMSYTATEKVNIETIYVYCNSTTTLKLFNPQVKIPAKVGINQTNFDLPLRLFVAAPELINLYQDGDLRKDRYIALDYSKKAPMVGPIKDYYLPFGKINIGSNYEPVTADFGLCFRLSEIYLTYAEACAKLGGTNSVDAIAKMDELLTKRYKPGSINAKVPALTGEELVTFIREERRKELCFESHRWFDQRRYGMKSFDKLWYEKGVVTNVIRMANNDASFTIKLSEKVLKNNPRLIQNEEWSNKY